MKRFLYLLMLLPVTCIAQDWSMGAFGSPNYYGSYVTFKSPQSKKSYNSVNNDFPEWGFTAGATVIRSLNENQQLETGLRFSQVFIRHRTKENSFPPTVTHTDYHMRGSYIDIPLKFNFVWGDQLQFIASGGLTFSFAVDRFSETTMYSYETPVGDNTSTYTLLAPALYGPEISAGAAWHFSDQWSVRLLPTFRFSFPAGLQKSYQMHVWSLGIHAGVCYNLGN